MSIITQSINKELDKENIIFKNDLQKNTMYSTEFKKINLTRIYDYGQNISININLLGDLLHRCFFQIEVPILNFTDNIINNSKYTILKNNKLNNLKNEINYWTDEYNNIYTFSNIQLIVYSNIKNLLEIQNLTLEFLKLKIDTIVENYSDEYYKSKLLIDANIIEYIDIISHIKNLSTLNIFNLTNEIEKKYNNNINYLNYYHSNKIYNENEYNNINNGKLFYKWVDKLSHHYFTEFQFYLDGQLMDNYSNDYLNIYQNHNIPENLLESYNNMIGSTDNIYNKKSTNNFIYTPLLFWFCKDISKSIPLVSLMNSSLKINTKINNIKNLIYLQDWEDYYNNILTISIPRKDHDINDDTNTITPYDLNYESVEIKLPENIYIYKCKNIDKKVLDYKFPGIDSNSIIDNYGSIDDNNNKYLSLNDFIYLMNNLKTDNLLSDSTKILIGDYHYFIDYNYLINLIPKPNISFIAEYCYVDDIERQMLAKNELQYLVEVHNEILLDINKYSIYDSLNEFNGLIKDIYYFSQLKLNLDGKSKYGQSEINNYINNFIEDVKLKLTNEFDLFEHNEMVPYYSLESQLPDGVKIITFSIKSLEKDPTGSLNMSTIKSQNIEIILKEDYLEKYYNYKNNPNNLGSLFKIIYSKYNIFKVQNGKGDLYFY